MKPGWGKWHSLMSDLSDWVAAATGNASARSLARKVHHSPDSMSRWLTGGTMPPGVVVQIARAYGANFLEGTIAAGMVSPDDVKAALPGVLRMARSSQLTAELHRRALLMEPAQGTRRA